MKMKITAMNWVAITTLVLVVLVIASSLNAPYPWVFALTVGGQGVLLLMVYRVLTDRYESKRTFSQGYQDHTLDDLE